MSKYIEMFHNIICLDDIYRVFVKHYYNPEYYVLAIIFKDKEEIVFNSFDIDEIDREYEKLKNALFENNELCNDIDDEPCDSEAKRIIKAVKQGKLPPIFDVDNQQTFGLELRPKKEKKQ